MSNTLQTILIPKDTFTKHQAISWMKDNGYPIRKIDETKNYYRMRQVDPPINKVDYYTIKLDNGVYLVYYS